MGDQFDPAKMMGMMMPGMFPNMMGMPGMPMWPGMAMWPGMPGMPGMPNSKSTPHVGRNPMPKGEIIGGETDSVRLPRKIMGLIIGKAGATIKNIRDVSGGRIDVEDKDDETCELKIQGNEEQVAKAKKMILEVAEKTPSGSKAIGEEMAAAGEGGISETVKHPGT